MSYRPGSYGGFKRPAPGRSSAPAPKPDRRAWLAMFERAAAAFEGDPSARDPALFFAASLKGLTADNFPLGVTDARRRWAKHFVELGRLWIDGGISTRTAFGPALAIIARSLSDLLIEQGAAEAQAGFARMGLKED